MSVARRAYGVPEDLSFAPQPAALLGVAAALVIRCGTQALGDLSIDDPGYFAFGKTAPLRFRGAEACLSAGEMRAGGGRSIRVADRYRLRVLDRGQRRPQRRFGRDIT